jgi:hypothetical protein
VRLDDPLQHLGPGSALRHRDLLPSPRRYAHGAYRVTPPSNRPNLG